MSIFAWIVLGLIAGFIASKIVNKTGEGTILDIVLGIVGAVVCGFVPLVVIVVSTFFCKRSWPDRLAGTWLVMR